MNYIKIFEDGTSEAVDVKPSWGMYEKEHALDNREVYIDGNWYTTTGGELVTNGTFDTDISGWTASVDSTAVLENNGIKVTQTTDVGNGAYQTLNLVEGERYIITYNVQQSTHGFQVSIGSTENSYDIVRMLGVYTATFIAKAINIITLQAWYMTGDNTTFDNISVYKSEPTIDTLQPPHTYLSNKGKLAGIEVANGVPVDIHYDELAPTLVEDTIKVNHLDGNEPNSRFVKNALNATGTAPIYACRAWVNFNGTGTVAIRASGNVSSITDNGVGDYTVNFITAMPDVNYILSGCTEDVLVTNKFTTTTPTTTSARLQTVIPNVSVYDKTYIHIQVLR